MNQSNKNSNLWIDQFEPNQTTTVVHSKKILELRNWLKTSKNKFIILTGPSGSGKTTTLKLLATELNLDIIEWINPTFDSVNNNQSVIDKFIEFMEQPFTNLTSLNNTSIIMIKDFPVMENINIRTRVYDSFKKYIECGYYTKKVVFIVTDIATSGHNSDGFIITKRTLFPSDLLQSGKISEIRFNCIAPTFLKKALKRITNNKIPSELIQSIVESSFGDIRCAVNMLQFQLLNKIIPSKKQLSNENSILKNENKNNCKEEHLVLFHGLGRILYDKRYYI